MNTMALTRGAVLCGLLAASLFGQTPAKPPRTPIFISPALADSVVLLTPPPALDSKKLSRDVAEIYAIHRSATPQEIERANWDNKHENLFSIAMVPVSYTHLTARARTARTGRRVRNGIRQRQDFGILLPCSDYRAHPARSRRSHHVRFPDRTAERRRNHCGNRHRSRTCFARLYRSRERNALVKESWARALDFGHLGGSFAEACPTEPMISLTKRAKAVIMSTFSMDKFRGDFSLSRRRMVQGLSLIHI